MSNGMGIREIRRVFDTGWGRTSGWSVERDGELIAVLDDYQEVDMFWASYRLEVKTKDEQLAQKLLDVHFWQDHFYEQGFRIRSREFDLVPERCLISEVISGRLTVRGLFVRPTGPAWKVLLARATNLLLGREW